MTGREPESATDQTSPQREDLPRIFWPWSTDREAMLRIAFVVRILLLTRVLTAGREYEEFVDELAREEAIQEFAHSALPFSLAEAAVQSAFAMIRGEPIGRRVFGARMADLDPGAWARLGDNAGRWSDAFANRYLCGSEPGAIGVAYLAIGDASRLAVSATSDEDTASAPSEPWVPEEFEAFEPLDILLGAPRVGRARKRVSHRMRELLAPSRHYDVTALVRGARDWVCVRIVYRSLTAYLNATRRFDDGRVGNWDNATYVDLAGRIRPFDRALEYRRQTRDSEPRS